MRKTKEFTIEKGRDKGKKFRITEMPVVAQERWATKMVCALLNSGVDLPTGIDSEMLQGLNGVSLFLTEGFKSLSKIKYEYAYPLYAELLSCVEYLVNGMSRHLTEETADEVIEDVQTLFILRWEVIKLHFGFLVQGGKVD